MTPVVGHFIVSLHEESALFHVRVRTTVGVLRHESSISGSASDEGMTRHDGAMTTTGGPVARQLDLFGGAVPDAAPEPVLMALHAEYYDLVWQGAKTHEFRRRFLEGRPVRWFVYLNAPVSRLAAVIELGPAVVGSPDEVAGIAERMRAGNGSSVLDYVRDLDRAFAIPILGVAEYPGLSAEELRAELGAFHPPQGYVRLAQHPELMAVCEKVAAEIPIRSTGSPFSPQIIADIMRTFAAGSSSTRRVTGGSNDRVT